VDTGLYSPASQAYRQTLFLGATGRNAAPLDDTAYQNNSFYGTNAEITWKSGIGTFTLLPAWRHSQLDSRFGNPGFVGWIREKDDQISLEARLATKRVSIFEAILGAYYFDETVNGNYTFAQQQLNAYQAFTSKTKSYAAFGRLTAHLSQGFRLIGGLRFTRDEKRFDGQADVFIDTCTLRVAGRPSCPSAPLLPVTASYTDLTAPFTIAPAGGAAPIGATGAVLVHAQTPVHASLPKSKATWRAGVEFDVTPRSLLYATVETGYRSGGFSLSAGYETFQPEYLTAYTIGSKNRFWNNRVQFNLEAFYWDYTNQQVNHSGIDLNGNQGQFTQNVGNSKIKGVEADLQLKATRTTLLSANIQYLDLEVWQLHLFRAGGRQSADHRLRLCAQPGQCGALHHQLQRQAGLSIAALDRQSGAGTDPAAGPLQPCCRRRHAIQDQPLYRLRLSARRADRRHLDHQCRIAPFSQGRALVAGRLCPQH
jgi:iron complex outermembrane receptor protein